MPVIRPITETSNCGSQVTKPLPFHRSRGWGVAAHKKFKQTCNYRLFIILLLGGEGVCASSHTWRSEDSIWKLVLSSHHGIKDWTQVVMLTQQACSCWATSLPRHTAPHDALRQNQEDSVFSKIEEKQTVLWQNWIRQRIPTACSGLSLLHFPLCNIHKR